MRNDKDYLIEMSEYDDDGISTEDLLEWLDSVGFHQTLKNTQ